MTLETILQNTLKAFNTSHKQELTFDYNKGESFRVLKILNSSGGALFQIKCSGSEAIDIINFMSHYLDKLEDEK